jgi:hypothetical protein
MMFVYEYKVITTRRSRRPPHPLQFANKTNMPNVVFKKDISILPEQNSMEYGNVLTEHDIKNMGSAMKDHAMSLFLKFYECISRPMKKTEMDTLKMIVLLIASALIMYNAYTVFRKKRNIVLLSPSSPITTPSSASSGNKIHGE